MSDLLPDHEIDRLLQGMKSHPVIYLELEGDEIVMYSGDEFTSEEILRIQNQREFYAIKAAFDDFVDTLNTHKINELKCRIHSAEFNLEQLKTQLNELTNE
jgi:hypothetical protein